MIDIPKSVKFFAAGAALILVPVGLAVSFLLLVEYSLSRAFGGAGNGDTYINSEQISPNGLNVASVYLTQGGGAAGWCYNRVNVRPANQVLNHREYVFSTNCGTDIQVAWENDSELHISYATKGDYPSFSHNKFALNGTVRLWYSEKSPVGSLPRTE